MFNFIYFKTLERKEVKDVQILEKVLEKNDENKFENVEEKIKNQGLIEGEQEKDNQNDIHENHDQSPKNIMTLNVEEKEKIVNATVEHIDDEEQGGEDDNEGLSEYEDSLQEDCKLFISISIIFLIYFQQINNFS